MSGLPRNHDGPHVWRASDGLCAVQFCHDGRFQEHVPERVWTWTGWEWVRGE